MALDSTHDPQLRSRVESAAARRRPRRRRQGGRRAGGDGRLRSRARARPRAAAPQPRQLPSHVLDGGADAHPSRSNGCNLRPGDLIASGTVSGPDKDSRGCLLELTRRGAEPIALPTGEIRKFLADGDEVVLRGWCECDGAARIGFGERRAVVDPAC